MPYYCNKCGAGPYNLSTTEFLDHALTTADHDKSKVIWLTESERAVWKAETEKGHSWGKGNARSVTRLAWNSRMNPASSVSAVLTNGEEIAKRITRLDPIAHTIFRASLDIAWIIPVDTCGKENYGRDISKDQSVFPCNIRNKDKWPALSYNPRSIQDFASWSSNMKRQRIWKFVAWVLQSGIYPAAQDRANFEISKWTKEFWVLIESCAATNQHLIQDFSSCSNSKKQ